MPSFNNYINVKKLLTDAQDIERDNRQLVKEDHRFIDDPQGQWEDWWWTRNKDKPRYTFDQTSPIVDQISGDIAQSSFDIMVEPSGPNTTKEQAQLRDGIIRDIEDCSDAQDIYSDAGRNITTGGFDAWMLTTEFADDVTFNKSIIIKAIEDSWDRVWFGPSTKKDHSDSKYGFLLSSIPKAEYQERYPNRGGVGLSNGSDSFNSNCNSQSKDDIIIGHIFFQKLQSRELVKTSLGRTFENNEEFKKRLPELEAGGETVEETRIIKDSVFWVRKFDGDGFLDKAEPTVFDMIPLVAAYGNFKVIDNQTLYRGVVRKAKDPQRVYNYAKSREIEEGAYAPREKIWATPAQVKGHTKTLATLNTNSDPVQLYNIDPKAPQGIPQKTGGPQVNQGLNVTAQTMRELMGSTAGIFAAGMGDDPGFTQSGVAIDKLDAKSNNVTVKYFSAIETAVCYTGKLIDGAMHRVYDGARMQRIVGGDGTIEMKEINVSDGSQTPVNEITKGKYNITCTAGPNFDSRQNEANEKMLKMAAVDPSLVELGSDILLGNANFPGAEQLQERKREQLFNAGMIPENQMTEEELEKLEIIKSQPPQPDAAMALAQAEQTKAEAEIQKSQVALMKVQVENTKAQNQIGLEIEKIDLARTKLQLDAQKQELEFAEKIAKLDRETQKQEFDQTMAIMEQQRQAQNDAIENLNKQAQTLKTLRESMGVDTIVGPSNQAAYIQQADEVLDAQNNT